MRTKLAFVSIFCVVFAAEPKRKPLDMVEFAKPCAEELKLPESDIEDFISKDKILEVLMGHKEPDHNGKCLLKCMAEKEAYVVGGEIDVDVMKEYTRDGVNLDFTKCKSLTDEDKCEQTYKQTICITTQIKDITSEEN